MPSATEEQIEVLLDKLKAPFTEEQIKVRQGTQGKSFEYVPAILVQERLDEVLPLRWEWTIIEVKKDTVTKTGYQKGGGTYEKISDQVTILGRLTLTLPDGSKVSRDACGGCEVDKGGQAGDGYKIADSNAFKKAAYKFGIAAHIGLDHLDDEPQDIYQNRNYSNNNKQPRGNFKPQNNDQRQSNSQHPSNPFLRG